MKIDSTFKIKGPYTYIFSQIYTGNKISRYNTKICFYKFSFKKFGKITSFIYSVVAYNLNLSFNIYNKKCKLEIKIRQEHDNNTNYI